MNPRDLCYCPCSNRNNNQQKYKLVIMSEDGMTYCVGRACSWDEIQQAVKEIRELYAKHGIRHHVGFHAV